MTWSINDPFLADISFKRTKTQVNIQEEYFDWSLFSIIFFPVQCTLRQHSGCLSQFILNLSHMYAAVSKSQKDKIENVFCHCKLAKRWKKKVCECSLLHDDTYSTNFSGFGPVHQQWLFWVHPFAILFPGILCHTISLGCTENDFNKIFITTIFYLGHADQNWFGVTQLCWTKYTQNTKLKFLVK